MCMFSRVRLARHLPAYKVLVPIELSYYDTLLIDLSTEQQCGLKLPAQPNFSLPQAGGQVLISNPVCVTI